MLKYQAVSLALAVVFVLVLDTVMYEVEGRDARMVRLCIASVDPDKLSSQCVMCNRREFPLTAIDCTGITKMNDLIANPLSVRQATCLVRNCRNQVPHIRPEEYHGSVGQAARASFTSASGTRSFGMTPPSGTYAGFPTSSSMMQYDSIPSYPSSSMMRDPSIAVPMPFNSKVRSGLGMSPVAALPYALVPAPYIPSPFGLRNKYKAALLPLFRK